MNAPVPAYPLNLHALVPQLMNIYPAWTCWDLKDFLEERTGRLNPEDWQTCLALYTRVVVERQDFEGGRTE